MTKVSIITSCYNRERTIRDAIESVLAQDYPDVEYIVVDGASKDNSLSIINEYKDKISTIISEPDRGMYEGINKGVRAATGDVIGLIHSDDFFYSNDTISKIVKQLEDEKAEVIYGDGLFVDEHNTDKVVRNWISGKYSKGKMLNGWLPLHPTVYIRRECFEEMGLYNESYKIAADSDFLLRYMYKAKFKIAYYRDYVVRMRMGGLSTSPKKMKQKWAEDLRLYRENGFNPYWTLGCKILSKVPQFISAKSNKMTLNTRNLHPFINSLKIKLIATYHAFRNADLDSSVAKIRQIFYKKDNPRINISRKMVILMVDGKGLSGDVGLSDRLKGAVYVYYFCKKYNIDFRINFVTPFSLNKYLVPNKYDWRIGSHDISYNKDQADIIHLSQGTNSDSVLEYVFQYLKTVIRFNKKKQIHVYCNYFDIKRIPMYSELFNELFKPSVLMQEELNYHCQKIQGAYINTGFRFMDLLGDFNEGNGVTIKNTEEKSILINNCLEQIEILYKKHAYKTVFVTSDSITFLKYVSEKLDYVYIIDGNVSHIGHANNCSDDTYLKAFCDYLMISNADSVYVLCTGSMYKSAFPYTASLINNKPFEYIVF